MKNGLIKKISLTFVANIISLLVSIIGTLLIPKIVGVAQYGYWQLYIFYISYAGVLHLGLCDGIYLLYGGRQYSSLDYACLKGQYIALGIYSIVFCILIGFGGYVIADDHNTGKVIILVCTGAFFHIAKTYITMILQATNRLVEYSVIIIIDRVVFIAGIIVISFASILSYENIILCDIVGRVVSLMVSIFYAKELFIGRYRFDKIVRKEFLSNIQSGSKLLIAGIASNFIIGFVRINVQNRWNIEAFARVSLSLSLINMILSFINMAAIIFFPILKNMSRDIREEVYKNADILLNFVMYMILLLAGLGGKLISIWLPQYGESAFYMILLLPMCIFESETSMLLNTYLKAFRAEKILMEVNILTMAVSGILAFLVISVCNNIIMAILLIDILVLFRNFMLKRILNRYLNNIGFKWKIYMFMLLVYMISYMTLDTLTASVLYCIAYLTYIIVDCKDIKTAISFFNYSSSL